MEIILATPYWYILLCLLAGLGCAWWLYGGNSPFNETPWLRRTLFFLRFLSFSIIAFLLLSPFIKSAIREVEKPAIAIAFDNSSSILLDSTHFSASALNQLAEKLTSAFKNDYEAGRYSFGSKVDNEVTDNDFSEKSTNISEMFDYLKSLYGGRNLGAVIMLSDGIYNKGSNPVYTAEKLKVPVYTIAVGDTTINRDVLISDVAYNKVAFLGNNFPVEVGVTMRQASGTAVTLTIKEDSLTLFSRMISASGNNYFAKIPVILSANRKGIHKYKIRISEVDGEKNLLNNEADIYVDVSERKMKILLLAQSPHPDIAAIKSVLDKSNLYETKVIFQEQADENFSNYNLVILHQLPSAKSTTLLQKIKTAEVPYFIIAGAQMNVAAFNNSGTGVTINQPVAKMNEVYAKVSDQFGLFSLSDDMQKVLSQLPPLFVPFGNYKVEKETNTLLAQRIGSIQSSMPLWYFSTSGTMRTGVLLGEGLWRWQLNEYALSGNHDVTDELILKSVQYLTSKEKKEPFMIQYKRSYTEGENIEFDATLYNAAGELINEPEVRLNIYNDEKKEFRYTFNRSNNAYQLNAGMLPPGRYTFSADTKAGDKVYKETGEFSVVPLLLENFESTANHQLLNTISSNTGGIMVTPDKINLLIDAVQKNETVKPVSYYHKKLIELISLKSLLAICLLLIAMEWFLRKRFGSY
ncbi:MAG TPA: vWA domain-containing protein [Bacteroidia bacterium]|nr:VWA domain-containing protein [Bacteroidia bacterium]QQR94602.1 MAG: VWA domain-containing protein [Bacteroidota bacterium]MBP8669168.1 VWA domain-containing protein [Bacteroidia bacterium]HOZ89584.1 vWA domain-containing protein [Bacteroidia bacterium]HQW18612.1 vWA domain-containing protein [Bacteroidia bacterium]